MPECVALAGRAEALGYTDVWTSEIARADAFTPLAAIAANTGTIRVGTAVVSVFTRPPALLAMTAGALQELAPGRFCLGLGTSTHDIVNDWMGSQLRQPLARVRETVEFLRLAALGEPVSFSGDTFDVRHFRLATASPEPVPIFLAGLGPQMLRLAGSISDGVVLSHPALSALPQLLADVAAGAGRPAPVEVVARIGVALDEDESRLRPMLRRHLAGYGRSGFYRSYFARQGFASEAREMASAWRRRDAGAAAAAVSDRLVDDVFVVGDADTCRQRIDAVRAAGVGTPVILPISAEPDPATRRQRKWETLRALAGGSRA